MVDALLRQALASRYQDLGMYEAALAPQSSALATRRRGLGEEHPDTLTALLGEDHPSALISLCNLADLLIKVGRHAEAAPLVAACVEGNTRKFGPVHGNTGRAFGLAVQLYESWDKAEPGKGYDAKAAEWKAKWPAAK